MNSDYLISSNTHDPSTLLECPDCGELAITTVRTPYTFTYGQGAAAVQITAELPMRVCGSCGLRYLDKAGQDAQHEAVCNYLGVLTPKQIKAIRRLYNLSRSEFAELTRLGEATIARWERGSLIQNAANDSYLRLVGFPENLERLRKWRKGENISPPISQSAPRQRPTFPALGAERETLLRVEQASFHLSMTIRP